MRLVASTFDTYKSDFVNCVQLIKWSPDGLFVLASSQDNYVRSFKIPSEIRKTPQSLTPSFCYNCGATILALEWSVTYSHPDSCSFWISVRDHPIKLLDAILGHAILVIPLYNPMEQLRPVYSIAFSRDNSTIILGSVDCLIYVPSRSAFKWENCKITRKVKNGINSQYGIFSCIILSPDLTSSLFAVGSFSKQIGIYDWKSLSSALYVFDTFQAIDQLIWPSNQFLFATFRCGDELHVWNLESGKMVLKSDIKDYKTNKRCKIAYSNNLVYVGQSNSAIKIFNIQKVNSNNLELIYLKILDTSAAQSTPQLVTSVCLSHNSQKNLIATATGERLLHYDSDDNGKQSIPIASLSIWTVD